MLATLRPGRRADRAAAAGPRAGRPGGDGLRHAISAESLHQLEIVCRALVGLTGNTTNQIRDLFLVWSRTVPAEASVLTRKQHELLIFIQD